jgi:hypothetical protein
LFLSSLEANGLQDGSAHDRHVAFLNELESLLRTKQIPNLRPFTIIHGSRDAIGMESSFHVWRTDWTTTNGYCDIAEALPCASVMAFAAGSGEQAVTHQNVNWLKSDAAGTSRAVFSAFCDALLNGEDHLSGGAPQLIGMFRVGPAEPIGIIYRNERFLRGQTLSLFQARVDSHEWRNTLFERCDPVTMMVCPGAQRHSRPRRLQKP